MSLHSVRNTLILACIFAAAISAVDYFAGGKGADNSTDPMRVDVWNCQDARSPANFKLFVKSNNAGAENIMLHRPQRMKPVNPGAFSGAAGKTAVVLRIKPLRVSP